MLKQIQQTLRKLPVFHRALRFVWSPPERVFRHLYFDGRFRVEVEPGVSFAMMSYGFEIENDLFWRGFGKGYEANALGVWREMVRTADFIADIGANTGLFALSAQALRPHARVIAFEPSARVFAKLLHNIELNGFPIVARECAISDRNGTAAFHDFPGEHQLSASLETSFGGQVRVEVPVVRLDDALPREGLPRIDAIKLDVEKHEPAALRGMRQTLDRWRPTLLVEILNDVLLQEIEAELGGLGYEFRRIIEPIKNEERNFLIAQPDRMAQIERIIPQGVLAS